MIFAQIFPKKYGYYIMLSKNISQYVLAIGVIILASYFASKAKAAFTTNDEYDLIRKYLLNDNPLTGHNRPKLWIHTKYEYNARKWESFGSRGSTNLNQPYIHLTVKTIINHCGDDFNICLIDDESFSRLLPGWKYNITQMAEPEKSYYRQLAFLELLYIYGGMIVPNSFICLRNLLPLYQQGIQYSTPFISEKMNRQANNVDSSNRKKIYTADLTFMGSPKKCETIKELSEYLEKKRFVAKSSSEFAFFDYTSIWCNRAVQEQQMNLIGGEYIGVKFLSGKPVLIEDLLANSDIGLDICPMRTFGIYIPGDEILSRMNYNWFSVMSSQELLQTNLNVVRYLQQGGIEV